MKLKRSAIFEAKVSTAGGLLHDRSALRVVDATLVANFIHTAVYWRTKPRMIV